MLEKPVSRIHNYWYVLAAQIFMMFLGGFMEERPFLYALFGASLLFVFGSLIKTLWQRLLMRILALIMGAIVAIISIIIFIPGLSDDTALAFIFVMVISYAVFILIAILGMSRLVFITDKVTVNMIVGGVCVYLLIGLCFTFIYTALGIWFPDGFDLAGQTHGKIEAFKDYLYFSFVTLTTTGYGDMLPTNSLTRIFAMIEMIIGPLFLAVMIARLVGMHISQKLKNR